MSKKKPKPKPKPKPVPVPKEQFTEEEYQAWLKDQGHD
jgi:hypothetical protein